MTEKRRKRWEKPQILSDLPLRDDDQAYFHFDDFAGTLALLAANPRTRTPLTVGVSGAWGSGKTTLLRRIRLLLDRRGRDGRPFFASEGETAGDFRACKTVWFDAWKYTDEDELLVALVRVILMAMKRDGLFNRLKALAEDPQQPTYDLAGLFINAFQFKFGGLGAEVQVKFDPQKFEQESPFRSHTAFFDYFDEAFERLLALWVHGTPDVSKMDETRGALVVFIDDLDRCLPEKTVQVLEAVKLFLDKPGCIFFIGAHTQVVQEAVMKHYAGMSAETAGEYLEKIIQLRFELPPVVETQMGVFLDDQKKQGRLPPEALEHWQTIVEGAERNPRKVKTFFNDLNLAWALLVNSGQAGGVDRADFTCWQVLMRAAPPSLKTQVYDVLDDRDLRFKFVQNLLGWANGDAEAAKVIEQFDFSRSLRLRRTLKKIGAFGPRFDAESLESLIYFVAPPAPEADVEKAPAEGKEKPLKPLEEAVERKRGEVPAGEGAPARPGGRVFGGLPFVLVPAGKFLMGARDDNELAFDNEKPQHTVEIPYEYWIGQFPVTNEQFARFVEATKHKQDWVEDWQQKPDHPVVNVSWEGAQAYCRWLNRAHGAELPKGYAFRLPTEAEWEKAARGEFGFEWPWGNEFDPNKCNSFEGGKGDTTPVGLYSPQGDSPYGCADMVGNAWEWTNSLFKPYPYQVGDGREDEKAAGKRVLRGGSFYDNRRLARCAFRNDDPILNLNINRGFRVAASHASLIQRFQGFALSPLLPEMLCVHGCKPRQNRRDSAAASWLVVLLFPLLWERAG